MPKNSVTSQTRLTSNEPQQKCIHYNNVPTDKFLTDKIWTKYNLFWKHYLTDSQFLHPRNTFVRNVIKIY